MNKPASPVASVVLCFFEGLVSVARAGGKLALVLGAPAWSLVGGTTPRSRIRTTAFVAHLCG